jgi:serine phosphatase RsbU (regulator of sigma subunit)
VRIILVLLLLILNVFDASANRKKQNTIFLSKDKFDENQKFDLGERYFLGNQYHIKTFHSRIHHFETDTIYRYSFNYEFGSNFEMNDSSYFEFWYRVYVDTSMANKTIGLDFVLNREPLNIFWDNVLVASQGVLNVKTNQAKNERIVNFAKPMFTGNTGYHNLVIKKYRSQNLTHSNYVVGVSRVSLIKDYDYYLRESKKQEYSSSQFFVIDGLRFFWLCVFVISCLFFIIVQRNETFFWFILFSLCVLVLSFFNFLMARFEITETTATVGSMLLLSLSVFSFLAFLFHHLSGRVPRRIYYYSGILPLVFLITIFEMVFNLGLRSYFSDFLSFVFFVFVSIIIVELIVQFIRIFKNRGREIIIAVGVLQFIIIYPILLFFETFDNWEIVKIISIYGVPISFLITLIYIIKDSFTENIQKKNEVISLIQANEKILSEQNIVLEKNVTLRTKELVEEKKLVEQKNTEILDSIEYAKRIQTTILPPPKVVKKYLDDSFILYLPKDIVAGDFYWMESVGDWVLFAACDCTGHGVPGALVSVVCHNALNRAVKEYNKIMPAEILDCVAELVLENFSTDDDVKDGMDASVCALNTTTGELFWAGANNPLWLIRHAELDSASVDIIEYKPNKQPIGKFDDRVPYTNHKIEIAKGDTIYLFTDGYADQFGGERGKKLTKAKFKEAILNMQRYNLDEQKKYLLDLHLNYKGNLGQVDDICVIGVRV